MQKEKWTKMLDFDILIQIQENTRYLFFHGYIKVLHKFNKNLKKYTLSFFYGYIKMLHKYQHDID